MQKGHGSGLQVLGDERAQLLALYWRLLRAPLWGVEGNRPGDKIEDAGRRGAAWAGGENICESSLGVKQGNKGPNQPRSRGVTVSRMGRPRPRREAVLQVGWA